MSNPLQLPQPDMRPGGYIPPGPVQPDPISQMLQTFLQFREQSQQGRTADAQIEEAKQRTAVAQGTLKLEQEKQKTQQALIEQQAAETDSRGKAVQAFLKAAQPAIEQHLSTHPEVVQGLMGGQGGGSPLAMGGQGSGPPMAQGGSPLAMPVQQPIAAPTAPSDGTGPIPTWGQMVQTMNPATAAAFVENDLPKLLAAQKSMQDSAGAPFEQANTGTTQTVFNKKTGLYFDGSKGLPMSDPRAWSTELRRGQTLDQKEEQAARIQLARDQAESQRVYREQVQNMGVVRQFDTRTKTLRERAPILDQALVSFHNAQSDPNPMNRRILYTTAIANFVQAADQKAQIRFQLLNYFKQNIDPSFEGKWKLLASGKFQGVLPDYVLKGMISHITNLKKMTQDSFDRERAAEVKRHPGAGNWLPSSEEFFSPDYGTTPTTSGEAPPPPP